MSSDRSIVSSAASCGKPQPIRSVGNSIRSHSEQRGSNMCTKGLASSRGCSLAAAALAIAAFAGLAGTASASMVATNLITNGNFLENAAAYGSYPGYSASPNPTDPTGWTGINGVNGLDTGFSGEPFAPASTTGVADFAFMEGRTASISQDVATAATQAYTLAFDGAARNGNPSAVLEVIVTDATNSQPISTFTPSITDSGFTPFSINFTATSASTNIEFLNNSPSGQDYTADVSNVSLVAVPEPATLGLVALGGLGLLLASRKRNVRV